MSRNRIYEIGFERIEQNVRKWWWRWGGWKKGKKGSDRRARSIVWRCPWALLPARKRKQCLPDTLNPVPTQHVRNDNNALAHYFAVKPSLLSISSFLSFFFLSSSPCALDTGPLVALKGKGTYSLSLSFCVSSLKCFNVFRNHLRMY